MDTEEPSETDFVPEPEPEPEPEPDSDPEPDSTDSEAETEPDLEVDFEADFPLLFFAGGSSLGFDSVTDESEVAVPDGIVASTVELRDEALSVLLCLEFEPAVVVPRAPVVPVVEPLERVPLLVPTGRMKNRSTKAGMSSRREKTRVGTTPPAMAAHRSRALFTMNMGTNVTVTAMVMVIARVR